MLSAMFNISLAFFKTYNWGFSYLSSDLSITEDFALTRFTLELVTNRQWLLQILHPLPDLLLPILPQLPSVFDSKPMLENLSNLFQR